MANTYTTIKLDYPINRGSDSIIWNDGLPLKYKPAGSSGQYRNGTIYIGLRFGMEYNSVNVEWRQTGACEVLAYFVGQDGDTSPNIDPAAYYSYITVTGASHTGNLTNMGAITVQPMFQTKYPVYNLAWPTYDKISPAVLARWAGSATLNRIPTGDTWTGNYVIRNETISVSFKFKNNYSGDETYYTANFINTYNAGGLRRRVIYDKNYWVGNIVPSGSPPTNPQMVAVDHYCYLNNFSPTRAGDSYRRNCDGRNYIATFKFWTNESYKSTPVDNVPVNYRWYDYDQFTPYASESKLFAMCDFPRARVEFYGNGNTGGNQTTQTPWVQNTAYVLPTTTTFVKTGHTFAGWYDAPTGGNRITSFPNGLHSADDGVYRLYAHWTPNTYRITFDKRGGTGGTDYFDIVYGVTDLEANPIIMPTKPGTAVGQYYLWGYWDQWDETKQLATGTCRVRSQGNWGKTTNTTFTSDTTLYAKWEDVSGRRNYDVNYNKGTADIGTIPGSQKKYYGTLCTLSINAGGLAKNSNSVTTNPFTVSFNYGIANHAGVTTAKTTRRVDTTYNMDGWATSATGPKVYGLGDFYHANEPVTLYPHFTPVETVTEVKTVTLPPITFTPGPTDCVTVTIDGWYTAATGGTKVGNPGATYTPKANTTLYARVTTVKKTALIKYVYGVTTVTRTLYPISDYLIENNEVVGITELNKIFKGWTTTRGSSTVNYPQGTTYHVTCPTTSGTTLLTLYPVWEDAPPEDVYIWQDVAQTANNGFVVWDLNSNNTQRVIRIP